MVDPELYYDWDGQLITRNDWAEMYGRERHIGDTHVNNIRVSTVWLGLNHNWSGQGPPLIFETVVFDADGNDLDQQRYPTLVAARAGHDQFVAKYRTR